MDTLTSHPLLGAVRDREVNGTGRQAVSHLKADCWAQSAAEFAQSGSVGLTESLRFKHQGV
jgi:hypothetical protein